jgi:hypothetical protein
MLAEMRGGGGKDYLGSTSMVCFSINPAFTIYFQIYNLNKLSNIVHVTKEVTFPYLIYFIQAKSRLKWSLLIPCISMYTLIKSV